ncbi:Ran-binding protein 10 [Savitreella phatthalungensis]
MNIVKLVLATDQQDMLPPTYEPHDLPSYEQSEASVPEPVRNSFDSGFSEAPIPGHKYALPAFNSADCREWSEEEELRHWHRAHPIEGYTPEFLLSAYLRYVYQADGRGLYTHWEIGRWWKGRISGRDLKGNPGFMLKTPAKQSWASILLLLPVTSPSIYQPVRLRSGQAAYFEVYIHAMDDTSKLAIGLAVRPHPTFRAPGLARGSIGLHSHTGTLIVNSNDFGATTPLFSRRPQAGDTIGCGISHDGRVFFTFNGVERSRSIALYSAKLSGGAVVDNDIHICLGMQGATTTACNFGHQPFKWRETKQFAPKANARWWPGTVDIRDLRTAKSF